MGPTGRMGEHFVQGRVDGTGGDSLDGARGRLWVRLRTEREILSYVVPKVFIAVDGTSLTLVDWNDIEEGWFVSCWWLVLSRRFRFL